MIESTMIAGDILSKVTIYELNREEAGRVTIEVHEVVAAPSHHEPAYKFVAYPSLVVGNVKQEYIAAGDSAEEALIKCLEKLKEVERFTDILEAVSPRV